MVITAHEQTLTPMTIIPIQDLVIAMDTDTMTHIIQADIHLIGTHHHITIMIGITKTHGLTTIQVDPLITIGKIF